MTYDSPYIGLQLIYSTLLSSTASCSALTSTPRSNLMGFNSCLSVETRLDYIEYCVPDLHCYEGQMTAQGVLADGTFDPRRRDPSIGPYHGFDTRL